MPAAGVAKPLRAERRLSFGAPVGGAWQRFTTAVRGSWQAAWDRATGVPSRIWGEGIAAPGAMASATAAEGYARAVLAAHLDLLAPGASIGDFVVVSNHSDGDIRSVGFEQRAAGRRVVGGQVSFRFKRDRLFLIGSEALPDVVFAQPRARIAPAALMARATEGLRRELALPDAPVTAERAGEEVVLPLVGDDAVLGYRLATTYMIDGGPDGRYLAYVDPASGAVLAVHQQNLYATGTVMYRSVSRHPGRGRADRPANRAHVTIGSGTQTTSPVGAVTWSPDVVQQVTTTATGDFVTTINKAESMAAATAQLSLAPGGQVVWDASGDAELDAQVVTYVATNAVKDYVRTKVDPAMPHLDDQIEASVNIAQNCNAFYDPNRRTINFYHASMTCQNTGLIEDVIYHEFGHALHWNEVIEGVGSVDYAMGEGAADFLAASITNDSGMGRGFFFDDKPLRELDPMDREFTWPDDIGEIHQTGKIYGGVFWDLRKALFAALGPDEGEQVVNRLFVGTLRRSVSIPTSLLEALATDDDDGNLANGTPHECFIRDAYGRHGLRTATGRSDARAVLDDNALEMPVRIVLDGLSERCSGDEIHRVVMRWKPNATEPLAGEREMTRAAATEFSAQLPLALDESVRYQAVVEFADGSKLTLPDNLGDPYYTVYQGTTIPLYCTDFESADPFTEGWTTGAPPGSTSIWEWGTPTGGTTDPAAAFSGTRILAQNLGGNYPAKHSSYVQLPPIDVGQWSDVRLQYRRWLAVEDGFYDQARVTVNGLPAWVNSSANLGESSSGHHIDREWQFHDVRLSNVAFGHELTVGFDLKTDEGLHLGGWAIDDLCVVANVKSVCGDGVVSPTEECDDGRDNGDLPGRCRTYCRLPACGDQIVDQGEGCDAGPFGSETCTAECERIEDEDGGCCSGSPAPGAFGLAGFVGLVLLRRPRRRRS